MKAKQKRETNQNLGELSNLKQNEKLPHPQTGLQEENFVLSPFF